MNTRLILTSLLFCVTGPVTAQQEFILKGQIADSSYEGKKVGIYYSTTKKKVAYVPVINGRFELKDTMILPMKVSILGPGLNKQESVSFFADGGVLEIEGATLSSAKI